MADIRIVRKTPAVLPRVIGLGLVLLLAALWVVWGSASSRVLKNRGSGPDARVR
jgi:hypothetical protein